MCQHSWFLGPKRFNYVMLFAKILKPSFVRFVGRYFLIKLTSQGETSSRETALAFEITLSKQTDAILLQRAAVSDDQRCF